MSFFQGARDKIVGDGEGEEESNNGTEVVTTIGPMMPDEYVYVPSLFPIWLSILLRENGMPS